MMYMSVSLAPTCKPSPNYQSSLTSIASLGQGYYCICVLSEWCLSGVCVCVFRHGKSWFSSASQFSGLKNVRKFMLFLSIKKCLNSHFFPFYWIFSNKFRLIVDIDVDLWALISKNWKKLVVYPKMSTILLKIVRKQCLHACDFFHVCVC